ncbi:MAG: response regulator [Rhodothermales bacterium]|nr:response regulator [Rhodothermales bacterium]
MDTNQSTATPPADPASEEQGLRMLLVEDNPINQKVAVRFLAKEGLKTDVANNGQEALDLFAKQTYDIVLMDIQMPVMDGITATENIRRIYGKERPYIIAVTANATPSDRQRCMDAGMNDFVTKPIDAVKLIGAITKSGIFQRH